MTESFPRTLLGVPGALASRLAALPGTAARGLTPIVALPREVLTLLDSVRKLVDRVGPLLDRVDELMVATEPAMRKLAPFADELVESVTREHARAIVIGLDMLPELEMMAIPAMRNMVALIPELDLVLERLDSIFDIIEGMPGAQRFKRRAQAQQENQNG